MNYFDLNLKISIYRRIRSIFILNLNLIKIRCKTHVLYHLIKTCYINFLLKIQNV